MERIRRKIQRRQRPIAAGVINGGQRRLPVMLGTVSVIYRGNVRCGVGDVEALLAIQQRRCVVVAVMSVDAMSAMSDVMPVVTDAVLW
jgi:hypothetical protein